MVLALCPVTAFAEETGSVATEAELKEALGEGLTTITLRSNVTLTSTLDLSDKVITLDLNGHTLKGNIKLADSSAAPKSILTLIDSTGVDMTGKECVIIGRSNIVGKPMALLALHRNATVTVCHSKTRNLPEVTRRADILISAVGKAGFVTGEMVKPGAVVIDVGMNRNAAGKLCGDVDFESVSPVAGWLTPVPGGVGPMTITMLLRSTVLSARNRRKKA